MNTKILTALALLVAVVGGAFGTMSFMGIDSITPPPTTEPPTTEPEQTSDTMEFIQFSAANQTWSIRAGNDLRVVHFYLKNAGGTLLSSGDLNVPIAQGEIADLNIPYSYEPGFRYYLTVVTERSMLTFVGQ